MDIKGEKVERNSYSLVPPFRPTVRVTLKCGSSKCQLRGGAALGEGEFWTRWEWRRVSNKGLVCICQVSFLLKEKQSAKC